MQDLQDMVLPAGIWKDVPPDHGTPSLWRCAQIWKDWNLCPLWTLSRARLTYHRNVDNGQRFQWFRLCSDLEALYCSVSVVFLDESGLVAVCVVVFMWRYVFH